VLKAAYEFWIQRILDSNAAAFPAFFFFRAAIPGAVITLSAFR
jgi:hypothetical protein